MAATGMVQEIYPNQHLQLLAEEMVAYLGVDNNKGETVWKIIIVIIVLILGSQVTMADIVSINYGGSNNVTITPSKYLEGFFFGNLISSGNGTVSTSGGGAPLEEGVAVFEVRVEVLKDKYIRGDEVFADITISNPAAIVGKAVNLTYYLSAPDGIVFDESREVLKEIKEGNLTIQRKLSVPDAAIYGGWRFNVMYNVPGEKMILAYDSFEVYEHTSSANILKLVGLLLVIMLVFTFHREHQKRKSYGYWYDDENSGELEDESSKE